MRRVPWLLSISLLLAACEEDGPELVELEDVGALCILGDGDHSNTSYVENASVGVHVGLDTCVSASTVPMGSCSIEQDGLTLHVSASGSYWTKPPGASTNECRGVMADCTFDWPSTHCGWH